MDRDSKKEAIVRILARWDRRYVDADEIADEILALTMPKNAKLSEVSEQIEELKEMLVADREYRSLGHRVVWNEAGHCNVPGVQGLTGEALNKQLERQKKYY